MLMVLTTAQVWGQKKVTYEFAGSILNSSDPISLKASGAVPPGVTVGTSLACTSGSSSTKDPNKDHGTTSDLVNWDKKLLGGYTTLYVTHTNSSSDVYFHDFKYEVTSIKWKRRSQVRATTSRGYSYATRGDGTDFGYTPYTEDDDEDYTTSGELFYHEEDFIKKKDDDGKDIVPFDGLKSLHVNVTSTTALHAIAVKEFEIEYYEPVPTLEVYERNEDGTNGSKFKGSQLAYGTTYNVVVTLNKDGHIGLFREGDLFIESSDTTLVSVDNEKKSGTNKPGGRYEATCTCTITTAPSGNGNVTISAIVKNNGQVAGKSSSNKSLKLKVGTDTDYEWTREKNTVYSNAKKTKILQKVMSAGMGKVLPRHLVWN